MNSLLTLLSVLLASGVHFLSPAIPSWKKDTPTELDFVHNSFPLQYFEGEFLSDDDVKYRVKLIKIYFLGLFAIVVPVGPTPSPNPPVTPQITPPKIKIAVGVSPIIVKNPRLNRQNNLNFDLLIEQQSLNCPVQKDKLIMSEGIIDELEFTMFRLNNNFLDINEVIGELRGGDLDFKSTAAIIGIIVIFYFNRDVGAFTPGHHTTPPQRDWLHGVSIPRNQFNGMNPYNCRQTQFARTKSSGASDSRPISEGYEYVPKQVSLFVNDDKTSNLEKAFMEVNRRANTINNPEFHCSFDRFKELATECGKIKKRGIREAISALEGEMRGYYKDTHRINYGPNINGPDFGVTGLGPWAGVTHLENKNPVSSEIDKAEGGDGNLSQQSRHMVKKAEWARKHWSNREKICNKFPDVTADALPNTPQQIGVLYDLYDVHNSEEKEIVINRIDQYTNDPVYTLTLNENSNI